jgi:lipoate-protein ligase B
MERLDVYRLPITPYSEAWQWQVETAEIVRSGAPEALAFLQHTPVYTLGRRTRPEHLLVPSDALRALGAEVIETNRGGDVTFHGPGQLVGYSILRLRQRDLGPAEYVRLLEETLMRTLARFDIDSGRSPGRPGVWTDEGKIATIGVRIERGVSLHGFALNVDTDLSWFDAIVPCGIAEGGTTSIAQYLDPPPTIDAVTSVLVREFATVFGVTPESTAPLRAGAIR